MSDERIRRSLSQPPVKVRWLRHLLPSPGNVIFTFVVLGALLLATRAGAFPLSAPTVASDSTTTISYQGRLADSIGNPVTVSGVPMQFRLYSSNNGGSALWSEAQPSVPVDAGLFHVLLGSTTPIPVSLLASNTSLWLGITVGADSEMTPREQVASVPYAMMASTVPNGSITKNKLASDVVLGAAESSGSYVATISVQEGLNPPTVPSVSPASMELSYKRIGSIVFVSMPLFQLTIDGNPLGMNISLPFPPSVADRGADGVLMTPQGTESIIMVGTQAQVRSFHGGFIGGWFRGGFWYIAQ